MRLLAAVLLFSSWLFVLTTAIPSPGSRKKPPKLVDGSMESLKEMARTREFKPVDPKTLPFETLKSKKGARRKSRCEECMANVLKLILETYPPGTRPIQQQKWHQSIMPIRKVRWRPVWAWFWSDKTRRRQDVVDAENLAYWCGELFTALPKPNVNGFHCYASDFDPSTSHIHDPDGQILVVQQDMDRERLERSLRQEFSDTGLEGQKQNQGFFGSQLLPSARNTITNWAKDLRDGATDGWNRIVDVVSKVHSGSSTSSSPKTPSPQGQRVPPPRLPQGKFTP